MRHSLDDVFYGIEALKTRYDPVEEECFDDPSTPKEPVDYEALDKGMEALEFEAEAIQTKSDLVLTCMEEMTAYQDYIRRNGIDRASLSLLNRNNRFSRYLNVTLPACESMTTVGSPYSELSLICMEGIGKTLKKFGKVLWKTIKAVFKWITTPFRALWKKICKAWKESGKHKCHLGTKEDIKKVIKALVEATQDIINRHAKKKKAFDKDRFTEDAKEILKGVLGETVYYVESDNVNAELSKNLSSNANKAKTLVNEIQAYVNAIDGNTTGIGNKAADFENDSDLKALNDPKAIWNNPDIIIQSNPDQSSKPVLFINLTDSNNKALSNTINDISKTADEVIKNLDTLEKANNAQNIPQSSQQQQTGQNNQQSQLGGTSGGVTDNEAIGKISGVVKTVQKILTFCAGCLTKSLTNGGLNDKYNDKIKHLLEGALRDFDVPQDQRDSAMQELNAKYHERISVYFNSNLENRNNSTPQSNP